MSLENILHAPSVCKHIIIIITIIIHRGMQGSGAPAGRGRGTISTCRQVLQPHHPGPAYSHKKGPDYGSQVEARTPSGVSSRVRHIGAAWPKQEGSCSLCTLQEELGCVMYLQPYRSPCPLGLAWCQVSGLEWEDDRHPRTCTHSHSRNHHLSPVFSLPPVPLQAGLLWPSVSSLSLRSQARPWALSCYADLYVSITHFSCWLGFGCC